MNSKIIVPELPFISNEDLTKHVNAVISVAKRSLEKSDADFYKNSVDPFSALFESLLKNISISDWIEQEKARQIQKSLQNALGEFHQNVIGSFKGWENLGTGKIIDVKNTKKKIIAEVKNKHNTTKGNHKTAIYDNLNGLLNTTYEGYIGYYVEIIPKNKKVYNNSFTPSDNNSKSRRPINEKIRVIDGKSFYELATGDPNALEKIYMNLILITCIALKKSPTQLIKSDSYKALFDKIY
ncbi:MAG: Eco47II family restriction endonuclease [Patescibacteria group bacterium]